MFIKIVTLFLLIFHIAHSNETQRINAYFSIGDILSAKKAAEAYLKTYPEDFQSYEMLIRTLVLAKEEDYLLKTWKEFYLKFPDAAMKRENLEELGWGILYNGKRASAQSTRLIALIAAALTRDARAISLLLEGLRDSNAIIRQVAVELSTMYRNEILRQEMITLFNKEKVWEVRQKVIEAVGELRIYELLPNLMALLNNSQKDIEEKKEIIKAISQLKNKIEPEEICLFVNSKRSVMRMLACECILENSLEAPAILLVPLLKDPQIEIRTQALYALGLQRYTLDEENISLLLQSKDPKLKIILGWYLLINSPPKKILAEEILLQALKEEKEGLRIFAAGAIRAAGKYGIALAEKVLHESQDPFVRINLALALVYQRENCEIACREMQDFLRNHKEQLMKTKEMFGAIQKSTLSHRSLIPNYPEVVNQTIRLEIINILAILEAPDIQNIMKEYLQEKHGGMTSIAAELLLEEGDASAFKLVEELLYDADYKIRVEAALLLATWAEDSAALSLLISSYAQADRTLKIKILESLGRIGDASSLPFLLERLTESSQTLRLIAACVLIQVLNH